MKTLFCMYSNHLSIFSSYSLWWKWSTIPSTSWEFYQLCCSSQRQHWELLHSTASLLCQQYSLWNMSERIWRSWCFSSLSQLSSICFGNTRHIQYAMITYVCVWEDFICFVIQELKLWQTCIPTTWHHSICRTFLAMGQKCPTQNARHQRNLIQSV